MGHHSVHDWKYLQHDKIKSEVCRNHIRARSSTGLPINSQSSEFWMAAPKIDDGSFSQRQREHTKVIVTFIDSTADSSEAN
jgi:hypothetical protein